MNIIDAINSNDIDSNDIDKLILLINNNNINDKYDKGNTALIWAVKRRNNKDIVELLLKYNANPNIKNNDGYTALILAVIHNNKNIIKILLDHNANINVQDKR